VEMPPAPSGVRSSKSERGACGRLHCPSRAARGRVAVRAVGDCIPPGRSAQRKLMEIGGEIVSNPENHEIATHEEVLALLSEKARDGSTSAMIALERALRIHGGAEDKRD
jgi:Na+-translocating ferredoxin:NAD+ oxidoreductase RNF subunit RnfB